MAIRDAMLPEFDQEMASTRKTLERVPESKFAWQPHPKSMTMQYLASHVANLPSWVIWTVKEDSLDLAPKDGTAMTTPQASSTKELVEIFDRNCKEARAVLAAATDEELFKPWTLMKGDQKLMTLPKVAVLRSFVMNHLIHHRAQLGVFLRLNDIPVPSIYGPSADEKLF